MFKALRHSRPLAALALSAALWGCDGATGALGPGGARMDAAPGGSGYTVVKEKDITVGTVTAVIGVAGGRMTLGKHVLSVPAGAVDAPTTFVMTRVGDDLRFSLTATQLLLNDVGSRGFKAPVTLTISYQDAATPPLDETKLRIIWIQSATAQQVQASTVDVTGKKVSAGLSHFSDYGLGDPARSPYVY